VADTTLEQGMSKKCDVNRRRGKGLIIGSVGS